MRVCVCTCGNKWGTGGARNSWLAPVVGFASWLLYRHDCAGCVSHTPRTDFQRSIIPQQEEVQSREGRRWKALSDSCSKMCRLVLAPSLLRSIPAPTVGRGVRYVATSTVLSCLCLARCHLEHSAPFFMPCMHCGFLVALVLLPTARFFAGDVGDNGMHTSQSRFESQIGW